jgi:cytidyltransferase-like protein
MSVTCCAQLAKQQGDFLLVGLHTDEDVEARRGPHTPIMNVHERALSVLACKYVDEVRLRAVKGAGVVSFSAELVGCC